MNRQVIERVLKVVLDLAQQAAKKTPSKTDDMILEIIESLLRSWVDDSPNKDGDCKVGLAKAKLAELAEGE